MIVNVKFELPSPLPRTAPANGQAETSDQSLPPFSESLVAASKKNLEATTMSSGSSRAIRQDKAPSGDSNTSRKVAIGDTSQASIQSQQPLPPQPALMTELAPVTNPIVMQRGTTFDGGVDLSDNSTIVPEDPARNSNETTLMGSDSGAGLSCRVQSHDDQPADAQGSRGPSQAESLLSSTGIQSVEAPAGFSSETRSQVSIAVAAEPTAAAQIAIQSAVQKLSSDAMANIMGVAASNGTSNERRGAGHIEVANSAQMLGRSAAENAASTLTIDAVPAQHAAMNVSAKGYLASISNTTSKNQAVLPAATNEQSLSATGHGVPGNLANELAALPQWSGGLHAMAQAGLPNVSRASIAEPLAMATSSDKDGSKGAASDVAGPNQPAQPAPDHTGSQSGSQDATPSGDQRQAGGSAQGQSAASALMNPANHGGTVIASGPSMSTAAPLEASPMFADFGGHAAIAPYGDALPQAAVTQALPVINTAKLIQSMGQSEMRVGMLSTEFGNISIRTSATRDLVSAQISLDHGELAKLLTVHLEEMQARLGGNQAMDVRIDLNGDQARQGAGTPGDGSSGSADASRGGRQQGGSTTSSYLGTQVTEQHVLPTAPAMSAGEGWSNSRLDIRV